MYQVGDLQRLPTRNPWVRGPRTAENNIVLLVEKVGRVAWVERHGLEAVPLAQRRTGPLPHAAHPALPTEPVAVGCHGDGMPVLEANIGAVEFNEEIFVIFMTPSIRLW